jgi:hypothetical protein
MAIVAYRGQGGDVDMDALLIQRVSETEAELSRRLQDGRSWNRRDETPIAGLPLSGDVCFSVSSEGVNLEEVVLTISQPIQALSESDGSAQQSGRQQNNVKLGRCRTGCCVSLPLLP